MRISVKGRYALAAVLRMSQYCNSKDPVTVISIAEKLGISKIYLEQVFSLLKRGKIVQSIKGAQGGYQLTRSPEKITVFEVLSSVDTSLFEKTGETVPQSAPEIESILRSFVFGGLDQSVKTFLSAISIGQLLSELEKIKSGQEYMFFI